MKFLHHKAYVNGAWVSSANTFEVRNPFDHSLIVEVADLGREECKLAIQAAHDAFQVWKKYAAGERAAILKKWFQLQMEHVDALADLLTTEQGKPLAEAKGEIRYGASFVEWFAEEARRAYGDVIPGHQRDKRITVIKQPVGVVGAITPWNFPNAMIT
ncbi:MAG: aldehyde dehydrogenase family protein, partial [Bacteroidota bacterium]